MGRERQRKRGRARNSLEKGFFLTPSWGQFTKWQTFVHGMHKCETFICYHKVIPATETKEQDFTEMESNTDDERREPDC